MKMYVKIFTIALNFTCFHLQIKRFLQFVKTIYSVLPNHMNKIFEPKAPIKVRDLMEIDIPELLKETFTITVIQTEKRNKDGTSMAVNIIYTMF